MKSVTRFSTLCSCSALRLPSRSSSSIPFDFTTSSSTFQPNFISLTNQVNRNEHYRKFNANPSSSQSSGGIPRLSRLAIRPISILHETPRVIVAGRSRCNGFGSNQYLLIHRESNTCVFIDASDDWPDDWIAFMKSSRVHPTHIFLTHCHIDNVLSLNTFLRLVESEMTTVVETRGGEAHRSSECPEKGLAMGIMWNPAEAPWVNAFPRACERYGRTEEMAFGLPLLRRGSRTGSSGAGAAQATPHYHNGRDVARWGGMYDRSAPHGVPELPLSSSSSSGAGEDWRPRLGRRRRPSPSLVSSPPLYPDILLSSATNRSTCFYAMGPHTPLHYIFTPGHSPGHTMLHVARERLLFTGDVLGYQHIGRVDLPWGIGARLGESLLSLESLPDDTVLLPGHGRLTTLGRERRHNRALQVLYTWKKDQPHREMPVGFNTGYL